MGFHRQTLTCLEILNTEMLIKMVWLTSWIWFPQGKPRVPEIVYGFGFSAGYKNFDFSMFMQGVARSSFFIVPDKISPFVNERNALSIIANNYWSENNPDPNAFWPRLSTFKVENTKNLPHGGYAMVIF